MSSSRGIRAVTEKLIETLAELLPTAVPIENEITSPINIYLVSFSKHPTWQNHDLPIQNKGQPGRPPLALNLYYIISACEKDQRLAHENLGRAMLLLHDRPVLSGFDAGSGIKNQVDPIRITFHPMSIDEMSKLWATFQAAHRPSVMYEVGVVLIESEAANPTPLPVTRRGQADSGWESTTQFPATLTTARFKTPSQPGARMGEPVTLVGSNLNRPGLATVLLQHRLMESVKTASVTKATADELEFVFPAVGCPPGLNAVSVQFADGEKIAFSSSIPIALLPEVLVPAAGLMANPADLSLKIPFRPALAEGQTAQVVIGSVLTSIVDATTPGELSVSLRDVVFPESEKGNRFARVRVDGIESLVFDPDNLGAGFAKYHVKGID